MSGSGRWWIEVVVGEGSAERFSLSAARPVVIGRDPASQVVLESKRVSRRHVELELAGRGLRVTDTSANGCLVGGEVLRGESRVVPLPATLEVGPYRIVVRYQPEPALAERGPSAGAAPERAVALRGRAEAGSAELGCGADGRAEPARPEASRGEREREASMAAEQQRVARLRTAEARDERVDAGLRRRIHSGLIERIDLARLGRDKLGSPALRAEVRAALRVLVDEHASPLDAAARDALAAELVDEALGLGPLEALLADASVSEIMVVDPRTIFIERAGRLERSRARFTDAESVRAVIERIVTPLGRRIDESTPLVDARLADGSRVNAVIPPLAIKGPCITIRKFSAAPLGMADLVQRGSLSERMACFLERAVRVRRNIVISGGTGSGKTTLLGALSAAIPAAERIVTIEDAAELRLLQPHVVSLESRSANMEGKGAYSIRDLVRNALRMRPDRIVVGECRGGEALDMLQAMNTGHEGSMTTTHANTPREALSRLETLCLMAGLDLPVRAIRAQLASSVHLIVQQSRLADGSRKVVSIAEVGGVDERGELELQELFVYERTGSDAAGRSVGEVRATGVLPSFLDRFIAEGLVEGGVFP